MARVHDRDGKPRPSEPSGAPPEVQRVDVDGVVKAKEEYWSGKLSKPTQTPESSVQGQGFCPQDPFAQTYPALSAFLRDVTYADGSRRTPGSVVLFVQDGMSTVCLTDKTGTPQVAFQAARTFAEALSRAEEGLRSSSLPWRASRGSRAGR